MTARAPALIAALVVSVLLALPTPALAAPPKIEVSSPLLQFARPGTWVPVHIDFATTDPVDAVISADFDGTDGIRGARRTLSVAKNSQRRAIVTAPVPDWGSTLNVVVLDSRGRPLAAEALPVRGRMDPAALHVIVVGEEPLGWPLLREVTGMPIPGHPEPAADGFRNVRVENVMPTDLPDQWFGYSAADLVVWRRPDPSGLSPEQQQAFRGWVAAGGTAIVALGDNHAHWTSSPLGNLTPLTSRSIVRSEFALADVWGVAGDGLPPGVVKTDTPEGPSAENGLPLVEVTPEAGSTVVWTGTDGRPLGLVSRPGTGRIVLLTFDPAAGELRGGFDRDRFWRQLLGLWQPMSRDYQLSDTWDGEVEQGRYRAGIAGKPFDTPVVGCPTHEVAALAMAGYEYGGETTPTHLHRANLGVPNTQYLWWQGLSNAIGDFAAAAPLSLYFILIFGALYLLLIGPLDYVVLRRVGKPMLTWITFPVLAIGFSVAAGFVIQAQKAGDSESHCLTLLDVMPTAEVARGTAWCSIWASRRTDLLVDVSRGEGWSLPARENDYDQGGYDGYGYNQTEVVGSGLGIRSEPGHALLEFEASQWSASNFRSQWIDAETGDARWYRDDEGGVVLRNDLGVDLVGAWIVDGGHFLKVGDVNSGSARAAVEDPQGPLPTSFESEAHQAMFAWAYDAVDDPVGHLHVGTPDRPVLVGFARTPVGVPQFEGLRGVDSSQTLVRVPLLPLEAP